MIKTKVIKNNLLKHDSTPQIHNLIKIQNLIFHKITHFTSIFTEYLIYDDKQEFLFKSYPKKYFLYNFYSLIKQTKNNFTPILINDWCRNLLKINNKFKKVFFSQLASEFTQKNKKSNLYNAVYTKILPSNLLENTLAKIKDNSINNFFNKKKEQKDISESESTIDNVNANNDISLSLDLKINNKYDKNILKQNIEFILGKNGQKDEDLLKVMKYLRPLNTAYIYNNKKNNKNIFLDYINNNKKNSQIKIKRKLNKNKNNNNNYIIFPKNKVYSSKNSYDNIFSNSNKINRYINANIKKNYEYYSKSNNKIKNKNDIISYNKNLINICNDFNSKTSSTKANSINSKMEIKIIMAPKRFYSKKNIIKKINNNSYNKKPKNLMTNKEEKKNLERKIVKMERSLDHKHLNKNGHNNKAIKLFSNKISDGIKIFH